MTTDHLAAPSMPLDKRQRAMLKEMGVRVWSPLDVPVAAPVAAATAEPAVQAAAVAPDVVPVEAQAVMAPVDRAALEAPSAPPPRSADDAPAGAPWQFDVAHPLFAELPPQPGPRWLVLAEASPEPATAHPLDGDAGLLLGNMLRAARLAHPGRVVLVPLRRLSAAPIDLGAPSALAEPLAALIAIHQPDLLLVMGRLAAQALLHTTEPLGKLRGRVHTLQGINTIVTYDAQPLLRTPADKAKAWDDLCLGIATAAAQAGPGAPGG